MPAERPSHGPRGDLAVSVVIPTRNRAHMLPAALESLAAQEVDAEFEVVVVDNASTDATSAILDRWCDRDARFTSVGAATLGRSPALNAGMRVARGPLLLFTDDDVVVEPGWIQAYLRFFAERGDQLLVAGGPIRPVPPDLSWPPWFSQRAAIAIGAVDWGEQRRLGTTEHLWGANMAVPASVFDQLGEWNEAVGVRGDSHPRVDDPSQNEDTEFQARVREAGGSVWYCPDAAIRHRTRIPGPRRCVMKGYANGRNEYWRVARGGGRRESRAAIASRQRTTAARLVLDAGRWLWRSAAFRVRPSGDRFERAWDSAWATGSRVEEFVDRRRSGGALVRGFRAGVTASAWMALKLVPPRA